MRSWRRQSSQARSPARRVHPSWFTALPAPTMTNAPNSTKNQPKLITTSFWRGWRATSSRIAAEPHQRVAGSERDHALDQEPQLAGEAAVTLFRHLQIIVVETDEAEAERHRQHDPDIGLSGLATAAWRPRGRRESSARPSSACPSWRSDAIPGRRCGSAGPCPAATQVIDDPGPEQEDEQRARHHRAAGAEVM